MNTLRLRNLRPTLSSFLIRIRRVFYVSKNHTFCDIVSHFIFPSCLFPPLAANHENQKGFSAESRGSNRVGCLHVLRIVIISHDSQGTVYSRTCWVIVSVSFSCAVLILEPCVLYVLFGTGVQLISSQEDIKLLYTLIDKLN